MTSKKTAVRYTPGVGGSETAGAYCYTRGTLLKNPERMATLNNTQGKVVRQLFKSDRVEGVCFYATYLIVRFFEAIEPRMLPYDEGHQYVIDTLKKLTRTKNVSFKIEVTTS